ncbi:hypothetical protein [uncultured Paludibaculum sp.]|uniref:hypothetical protein n=1 Tax=uncultured Paludibaculum sp. TaxID=1765020 RepID=UPI002AAC1A0F|nr:hypothetical protein [uncultured Paludibaculum sp.]
MNHLATSNRDRDRRVRERQDALIATNVRWLRQALTLLGRLNDAVYASMPQGLAPHRAGSHLRHILEFYECFLEGVDSAHIDYDARRRDEAVERCRAVALARIESIIQLLEGMPSLRCDNVLWVRMEDADPGQVRDSFLMSSVSRELQTLSSHTIHHFALIAVTLLAHGVAVDPDFGVAPSTLRHRAKKAEAA